MKLYENESEVLRIGAMQFENRLDRITVSGDIDLTRDKAGLADARALHELLGKIVGALEAAHKLPDALPPPQVKRVSNPFE